MHWQSYAKDCKNKYIKVAMCKNVNENIKVANANSCVRKNWTGWWEKEINFQQANAKDIGKPYRSRLILTAKGKKYFG